MDSSNVLSIFNEITSFVESNNNLSIGSTGNVIDHDVQMLMENQGVELIVRLQKNQM